MVVYIAYVHDYVYFMNTQQKEVSTITSQLVLELPSTDSKVSSSKVSFCEVSEYNMCVLLLRINHCVWLQ